MRLLTLAAAAVLTLGASALGAVKTYTIAFFPEEQVNSSMQSFSFDPRLADPFLHGAQITGARLIIDFTPANGFDSANLGISLTVPHADIDYTSWHINSGVDMGWSGQGQKTATISSNAVNGLLHVGGRAIWFLDIYSVEDIDPPAYSGTFGPNTRIEFDYIPVPRTIVAAAGPICATSAATFTATTSCDGVPTYTWQCIGGPATSWTTLTAGANMVGAELLVNASGVGSDTLVVNRGVGGSWPTALGTELAFRCIVDTVECESIASDEVYPPIASNHPAFAKLGFPFTTSVGGDATLNVYPDGVEPFTFAWRKNGAPIDPVANPTAHEAILALTNLQGASSGTYDCLVTDACGTVASMGVTITICGADYNCDELVSIDDLFLYFNGYFTGAPAADFNGVGGVTIDDLFLYINAYFTGC